MMDALSTKELLDGIAARIGDALRLSEGFGIVSGEIPAGFGGMVGVSVSGIGSGSGYGWNDLRADVAILVKAASRDEVLDAIAGIRAALPACGFRAGGFVVSWLGASSGTNAQVTETTDFGDTAFVAEERLVAYFRPA